jgi:pre-mRNA-processing factor SLU7
MSSSYCTGAAGIEAANASTAHQLLNTASSSTAETSSSKPLIEQHVRDEGADERDKRQGQAFSRKKRMGEGDIELDQARLDAAIREEKRKRRGDDDDEPDWVRDKKKKYDTGRMEQSTEVTEEELEAYRRTRSNFEDPVSTISTPIASLTANIFPMS